MTENQFINRIYPSKFAEEMEQNPQIRAQFIGKFRRTMLDLGIPPGIWCQGESEVETTSRISDYADQIAFRFRDLTWNEIQIAWTKRVQRSVITSGAQFNLPILFTWLTEIPQKKPDLSPETPAKEIPPDELWHLLRPHFESAMEKTGFEQDLPFTNPGLGSMWSWMGKILGEEKQKEIAENVQTEWLEKLASVTMKPIREGESVTDYAERLRKHHRTNELPSGKIMQRKAMVRAFLEIKLQNENF